MSDKQAQPTCPKCGGLNGYTTTQKRTVTRVYFWNGQSEDADNGRVLSESGATCMDCGKPLTRAAIAKAKGAPQ